ncbi:MAG: hypothetical protein U1A78_21300 [Polyangia bacterium]
MVTLTSPRSARLAFAGPVLGLLAPILFTTGCESEDPCVRRTAACIDVTLIGRRDDGMGNPAVYRDLSVKVCAPNPGSSGAKCGDDACGTELVRTSEPLTLMPVAPYSNNTQGKISFRLPDSFNELPDLFLTDDGQRSDLAQEIDALSAPERKARLLSLRDSDPRAIRVLVTQSGAPKPAWDSRCEEDLFSDDEWAMLRYHRVGKNEARPIPAPLRDGKLATP